MKATSFQDHSFFKMAIACTGISVSSTKTISLSFPTFVVSYHGNSYNAPFTAYLFVDAPICFVSSLIWYKPEAKLTVQGEKRAIVKLPVI